MTRKKFTFVSKAKVLQEDTFSVIKFKGVEGISRLYEFDITLVSEEPDIDLKEVIKNPATFNINFEGEDFPTHGRLAHFEHLHEIPGHYYYRAVLVPKLWQASLYHESQVFLDKSVKDIIEEILKQVGLTTSDYEFKLAKNDYCKWEYICQYQETHLNFLSRWMESEGIYYFFEQTEKSEKLIITDSVTGHQDIKGEKTVNYSPPSGLDHPEEEVVSAFLCRQRTLPKKVILNDYHFEKSSVPLEVEEVVDNDGQGEVYIYGEHITTTNPDEVEKITKNFAKIRAEELLCREKVFYGEGTVPTMSPGFVFILDRHYRDSYNNQEYLITEVEHNGGQTGAFLSGLKGKAAAGEEELGYSNRFACISKKIQFRPERKTPKPMVRGSQTARVVGPKGEKIYTDKYGRVKVQFHWDHKGKNDEHSSYWIRVGQLWAGAKWGGMHIPHIGQEVLVEFVEGDPDRPIITGRVYNDQHMPPENPEENDNIHKSIIRDDYNNELVFNAKPGASEIVLWNPDGKVTFKAGKSNTYWTSNTDAGELFTGTKSSVIGGAKSETFIGSSSSLALGFNVDLKLAAAIEAVIGSAAKIRIGPDYQISKSDKVATAEKDYLQLVHGDAIIDSIGEKDGKLLLVAGGSRESLLKMNKESLSLSVGEGTRSRIKDINREDMEAAIYIAVITAAFAHSLQAVSTVTNYIGLAAEESWTDDNADNLGLGLSIASHLVMIAANIFANYFVLKLYYNQMDPDSVKREIETHTPNAKIEMKKEGDININSNSNSEYDRKITLQVGPPKGDPEAEILMTHEGIKIDAGKGKAEIHIKKDGNISIWSDKDLNIQALGDIKMKSSRGGKVKLSGNTFQADPNMTFDWRNLVVV